MPLFRFRRFCIFSTNSFNFRIGPSEIYHFLNFLFITGDDFTNHRRRQKKEGDDDEYMFHLVSYKCFRLIQYVPELGRFYTKFGFYLVVFLGVYCFRGGLLFYLFSIHKLYYDVSVFISVSDVPRSTFSELSNPFTSIWENVCSLTVFSTFLPLP